MKTHILKPTSKISEKSDPISPISPTEKYPIYSVTSYGADYPIDSLVNRLNNGSIFIPSFQRNYVWKIRDASRFIESLLLGLPVPGIFLSKEEETEKLLVIDGQQRLLTLKYFYKGIFSISGKEFTLQNVLPPIEGKSYDSLSESEKRKLDNSIIHATIIKQDEPSGDDSSIYEIFERLNTGGKLLYPQEIRSCIYHGIFNDLLGELNTNEHWRDIYKPSTKQQESIDHRMRDQELVLRFFALNFEFEKYTKSMKNFLNHFMQKNRNLKIYSREKLYKLFTDTMEMIHKCIGNNAFRLKKQLNHPIFDSVMIGIARNIESLKKMDNKNLIKDRYDELLRNNNFLNAIESGTTDVRKVNERIKLAIDTFSIK